jgi:hypothetical protein
MMAVLITLLLSVGQAFATNTTDVANSTSVVSPFWQATTPNAGGSYTFVAITHPSLSGMHSQIGVTATAMLGAGDGSEYGTSVDFTVSAGETYRLFIFGTPQGSGSLFQGLANVIASDGGASVNGIIGTSTGGTGYLRFDPIATNPTTDSGDGYQDITMLSYWGAVVFDNVFTGFAMEFIGDMNDSSAHPNSGTSFPAGLN